MITEAILSVIFGLVKGLLALMPSVSLPAIDTVIGGLAAMVELGSYVNCFLPLDAFGVCIGVWLVIQGARNISVVINWLIAKIPGVN